MSVWLRPALGPRPYGEPRPRHCDPDQRGHEASPARLDRIQRLGSLAHTVGLRGPARWGVPLVCRAPLGTPLTPIVTICRRLGVVLGTATRSISADEVCGRARRTVRADQLRRDRPTRFPTPPLGPNAASCSSSPYKVALRLLFPVVPEELADELYPKTSKHYEGDPNVKVIIEPPQDDSARTANRRARRREARPTCSRWMAAASSATAAARASRAGSPPIEPRAGGHRPRRRRRPPATRGRRPRPR